MIDCHLHLSRAPDPQSFIRDHGREVEAFVTAACSREEIPRCLELLGRGVYAFIGTHPLYAGGFDAQAAERQLRMPGVLGIGECGLDRRGVLAEQLPLLRAQLSLACDLGVPVCIHLVGCHGEFWETARAFQGRLHGFIHDFSGSYELYRRYAQLGLKISLSARALRRGRRCAEAVARAEPGDLLLESDYDGRQPYAAAQLQQVAQWVSQVRGRDCQAALQENAQRLLQGEW